MAYISLITINLLFPVIVLGYLLVFFVSSRKELLKNLRYELPERFGFYKTKNLKNVLWFHAASVGEVKSIRKIAALLKENYPDNVMVVTTSTDAGKKTAKKLITENSFLAPLDFYPITRKFIKTFRPIKLFVVESEIWPNMFTACGASKIPIFIINGRLSRKSAKLYKLIKPLIKYLFEPVKTACVQTVRIAKRYQFLGMEKSKIFVTGNIKYDLLETKPPKLKEVRELFNSLGWQNFPVIVCGSTHPKEESIILNAFRRVEKKTNLKLVLVPRHLERLNQIKQNLKSVGIEFVTIDEKIKRNTSCVLVDKMGWLTSFYADATICFVGGTLINKGGHNLLEPAILKKPLIFGKYTFNTPDVAEKLLKQKGAVLVTENDFARILIDLLKNPDLILSMGKNAFKTAGDFQGATLKTYKKIR